jgi:hypothetical protein
MPSETKRENRRNRRDQLDGLEKIDPELQAITQGPQCRRSSRWIVADQQTTGNNSRDWPRNNRLEILDGIEESIRNCRQSLNSTVDKDRNGVLQYVGGEQITGTRRTRLDLKESTESKEMEESELEARGGWLCRRL